MNNDVLLAFTDDPEQIRHPFVTLFHIAFKISAFIAYLLCGWFIDEFITSFVIIVFLLSADFWIVKNVSGRLLVGLRWWNSVDENGNSLWNFEARKGKLNPAEARIFWLALVLTEIVWSILFFIAFFGMRFKWMLLDCIALMLNGSNLYGYIKCRLGKDESIKSSLKNFVQGQMFTNLKSWTNPSKATSNKSYPI